MLLHRKLQKKILTYLFISVYLKFYYIFKLLSFFKQFALSLPYQINKHLLCLTVAVKIFYYE